MSLIEKGSQVRVKTLDSTSPEDQGSFGTVIFIEDCPEKEGQYMIKTDQGVLWGLRAEELDLSID